MDLPEPLRVMIGTALVASLAATLIAGLLWAYNPEEGSGLQFLPDTIPLAEEPTATPAPEPTPTPTTLEPSPEPTPTVDPGELIAAAAEPSATTVQVLDAGGGSQATQAAVAVLVEELGYQVINVTSSRTDVERTTLWYSDGHEAEALALRARDGRFGEAAPNERLNEGTNVHVLVGPDWPSG